jgi:hypothetical protein
VKALTPPFLPLSDIGGIGVSQRTQSVGTGESVTANDRHGYFRPFFNSQEAEVYAIALRDVTRHGRTPSIPNYPENEASDVDDNSNWTDGFMRHHSAACL